MNYTITVLPGDGIGPEVTEQAVGALRTAAEQCGIGLNIQYAQIGGAAIDEAGVPLPDETIRLCQNSDAVLLGAVGGPKWDALPVDKRPEKGLLGIRAALKLFANLRPAIVHAPLKDASPLKTEILGDSLDIMVVRELTGGIYFGERGRSGDCAWDTEKYSAAEVRRVAKVAFELAVQRGGGGQGRLCSVDKSNVLESSRLWRETVTALAKDYPSVALSHMYVDNAAMQLVRDPQQFDVIVTSNMFGDILSDEASQITGSIGMLPSASLGNTSLGLYEPVHGSAPDIAGQDKANPIAAILSAAMALRWSLKQPKAADAVEAAVAAVLEAGLRTGDIIGKTAAAAVGTSAMGAAIIGKIKN